MRGNYHTDEPNRAKRFHKIVYGCNRGTPTRYILRVVLNASKVVATTLARAVEEFE
jgi:hypothetical protein